MLCAAEVSDTHSLSPLFPAGEVIIRQSVPPYVSSEDSTGKVPLTPSNATKSIIFIFYSGVLDFPIRKAGLLQSFSCPWVYLPKSALSRCYPHHGWEGLGPVCWFLLAPLPVPRSLCLSSDAQVGKTSPRPLAYDAGSHNSCGKMPNYSLKRGDKEKGHLIPPQC